MKKLIDKIPPVNPPPTPPPATNSPPIIIPPNGPITITSGGFKMLNLVTSNTVPSIFVPTSGTNCEGMVSWNLQGYNYLNTSNNIPFARVICSSILASTNPAAPKAQWQVVGSRMIWANDAFGNYDGTISGGALVVYYNSQGQWRGQVYIPYSLGATNYNPNTLNPIGTDDLGVQLLADEVGYGQKQRYFRLASPTNYVGVLTNGIGY